MRGPDSLPREVNFDEGWANDLPPILAVPCPCCKGSAHARQRSCPTSARIMTRELGAFLSRGEVPLHGLSGWANQGDATPNLPGCLRCGDAGVVPVDTDTEEML